VIYGYSHPHYSYDPHYRGYEDYYAGLSLPGMLFPPAGLAELAYGSGQGGGGGGSIRRGGGGGGGGRGGFDWSLLAKAGVVVGGVLAIYAIYRASNVARGIQEETGSAATKIMLARGGKGAGAVGEFGRLLGAGGGASAVLPSIEVKQLKA
jgi:hypothetical protein